jgi:hypothetical protein
LQDDFDNVTSSEDSDKEWRDNYFEEYGLVAKNYKEDGQLLWKTVQLIVDTGATTTIGEPGLFIQSSLVPCNTKIECANGEYMVCKLRGTMLVKYEGQQLVIPDALCMEGVVNLLSVNQLVNKGYILVFDKNSVGIYTSKNNIHTNKPFMFLDRKIGEKLWVIDQPLEPCSTWRPNIHQATYKNWKESIRNVSKDCNRRRSGCST